MILSYLAGCWRQIFSNGR